MEDFSYVANISFTESSNFEDAHILWASLDDVDSEGALGYSYVPEGGAYDGLTTLNYEAYSTNGQIDDEEILLPGSYYYVTATHELGHALGLEHPFEGSASFPGVNETEDLGDNGLNAQPYTVHDAIPCECFH